MTVLGVLDAAEAPRKAEIVASEPCLAGADCATLTKTSKLASMCSNDAVFVMSPTTVTISCWRSILAASPSGLRTSAVTWWPRLRRARAADWPICWASHKHTHKGALDRTRQEQHPTHCR